MIQHGDGTLIYAYVQFEEEEISGIDLLTRSGINATIAPYGGLGGGVCSINGEGCPADNCFCESYTSPAYFWHYYILDAGTWVELPLGASSRMLGDGDVDAWSWSAGEHGLPATTIDEIAALNGVDRNQPEATPTPLPTDTAQPTATSPPPPTPTNVPPSATPTPLAATATATVPSSATPTVPGTPTLVAQGTPSGAATATNAPTATPRPSPTTEPTSSASATTRATVAATSTERPTSVAVIVTPGATPQPLPPDEGGGGNRELLVFGALLAGVAVVGATVLARNRRNGAP